MFAVRLHHHVDEIQIAGAAARGTGDEFSHEDRSAVADAHRLG
jgi:hypothetical protein